MSDGETDLALSNTKKWVKNIKAKEGCYFCFLQQPLHKTNVFMAQIVSDLHMWHPYLLLLHESFHQRTELPY